MLSSRDRTARPTGQAIDTRERLKGFTFSPKSFSPADITEFFTLASEGGDVISWHGPWDDLSASGGAANLLESNAKKYDFLPIAIVHNAKEDNAGLKTPFTEETKADYTKRAVDFVTKYKPAYFGIGIEINRMAIKAPQDFDSFVAFYPTVVQAIKDASPQTQIVTTFELNSMKGLNGGLFGGRNDPSKNQWDLLAKFDAADVFAFSIYPSIIYKSPADISDSYLSEIASKTTKPIAFTEIGWPSKTPAVGWETNEEEQAEFIRRFFQLSQDLPYRFAIWSFLYDVDAGPAFKGMGLVRDDGTKRPSWEAWITGQ